MSLWDQVKDSFVELYSVAADKTGEAARVGLRRYDKMGINWDIKRLMTELGGLVYHAASEDRDDVLEDPAVRDIIERIRGLESEMQQKEQEIADIKQQGIDSAPAGASESTEPGHGTSGSAPAVELPAPLVDDLVVEPVLESKLEPAPELEPEPEPESIELPGEVVDEVGGAEDTALMEEDSSDGTKIDESDGVDKN